MRLPGNVLYAVGDFAGAKVAPAIPLRSAAIALRIHAIALRTHAIALCAAGSALRAPRQCSTCIRYGPTRCEVQ
eukprot:215969-Rhodomonas_salina.2